MKNRLKGNLVTAILILLVYSLGVVLAGDVIVKEGAIAANEITANEITANEITADVFKDQSLIGYWQFNRNAKDSSMYENHGTPVEGPGLTKDVLTLDGVEQYVDCQTISPFDASKQYTYSVWTRADSALQGPRAILSDQSDYYWDFGWALLWDSDKVRFQNGQSQGVEIEHLQKEKWYHIAVTYDGGDTDTCKIYLDGKIRGSADEYSFTSNVENFRIGWWDDGEQIQIYKGMLDNVMIFERVLEPWEIRQLYNKDNKKYGYFNELVGDLEVSADLAVTGTIEGGTVESEIFKSPGCTATGTKAVAFGSNTEASGDYSTAMGSSTQAGGQGSTAMGIWTTADGDVSTAMGIFTTASALFSTAIGKSFTNNVQDSFAVGFGQKDFSVESGLVTVGDVSTNDANLYVTGWVSGEDLIDRSSFYDKDTYGRALDYLVDSSRTIKLNAKGEKVYNHEADPEFVQKSITLKDYDKYTEEEVWNEKLNRTIPERIYQTRQESGSSVTMKLSWLTQCVFELKQENQMLKDELAELKNIVAAQ